MKITRSIFGIAIVALVAVDGIFALQGAETNATLSVSGEATLVEPRSREIERDASNIVVWLVPANGGQSAGTGGEKKHFRMVQHNKRFEPRLLVVPVGSVVDFPNLDPWFHNVFSLYRGKRFDLGLYQAGSVKSVSFDRPGPSYLFCNIHPEMTGVVLAVDSDLFAISDKGGRYAIGGVVPGKYLMRVWYENATPEALQSLQRTVSVEEGTRSISAMSIPVVKQVQAEHKNKYGQSYDPDTLKTDY